MRNLRPVGNKVVIRYEKINTKIILPGQVKDQWRIKIVAVGPDVKADLPIGAEILKTPHSQVYEHSDKDLKDFGVMTEQDIWAVIVDDETENKATPVEVI